MFMMAWFPYYLGAVILTFVSIQTEGVLSCNPGHYSINGGCAICPSGSFCVLDTKRDCPAGTFNTLTKQSSVDSCNECPRGKYSTTGSSVCTQCPAGKYCEIAGTVTPMDCPKGSYSLAGASICINCPVGYSCTVATSPARCNPGEYSPLKSMTCTRCKAGTRCPTGSATEILCTRGYYSLEGQSSCTKCPAGFYCPADGVEKPTPCPENAYSTGQASLCQTCPQGYSCSPSTAPIVCQYGWYSPLGSMTCTKCRPGYYCPYKAGVGIECSRGSYSLEGQKACTDCPAGHYCPNTAANYSTPCPKNTYSTGKASMCYICPEGSSCRPSASPIICQEGQYSPVGSMTCTPCRPGYYCPYKAGSERECPRGTYSLVGQKSCTNCPAGQYCPDAGSNFTIPCPENAYSTGKASSCIICPEGYSCRPSHSPAICTRGEYSPVGAMTCTPCRPGYYCPYKVGFERECPRGTYSLVGQESCTSCPAGQYCPDAGSNFTLPCPENTYSTGKASSCIICPEGYSCRPSLSPAICTRGEYSPVESMTCTPCRPGYYCPYKAGAEIKCPRGTYSLVGQESCTYCPAGQYCPDAGSNFTIPCPENTYSVSKSSSCTICPEGYSCRPYVSPVICLNGEYSPVGAMTCTPCRPGYYCPYKAGSERECPRGTYSLVGQKSCTSCPAGQYCPDAGSNFTIPCPENAYSTGKASICIICPEGFSCRPFASPTVCIRGEYSPVGAMTCTPCRPGYYCPYKAGAEIKCPRGTYSLVGQESCTSCPAGQYCPDAGSSFTIPCPENAYSTGKATSCITCPEGHSCRRSMSPTVCVRGQYSSVGSMTCTPCRPGYYCPYKAGAEIKCPRGTYSLVGQESCTSCPAGQYCPDAGSNFTIPCPENTYSAQKASLCTVCPEGYSCTPSTSPVVCKNGEYSAFGSMCKEDSTNMTCTWCNPGYYCPPKAGSPLTCPRGTYSLGGASACKYCPAGTYCSLDATSVIPCPKNTYSTGKANTCTICPPGYSCTPSTSPIACKTGEYSPLGSMTCSQCRPGTYCIRQAAEEVPCPDGFTSSAAQTSCTRCEDGSPCPTPPPKPINCDEGFCYQVHSGLCVPCFDPIPACPTTAQEGLPYVIQQTVQSLKEDVVKWKIKTNEDDTNFMMVAQCFTDSLQCDSSDDILYSSTIQSLASGTYKVALTIKEVRRYQHKAILVWFDGHTIPRGNCSLEVVYPPSSPPVMTINTDESKASGDSGLGMTLINAEAVSVRPGQSVIVRCRVDGGQPAVSDISISCGDKSTTVAGPAVSQTWHADMSMNQRRCVCSANHVTKEYTMTTEFTINIVYSPRSIALTANSKSLNVEVAEGQDVVMTCGADGHPAPMMSIKGRRSMEHLTLQASSLIADFTSLRQASKRVVCTDTDTYVCTADNNLGWIEDSISLFVKCAPKLPSNSDEGNREFIPNKEGELEIRIPVIGHPTPKDYTLAKIQENSGRGKRDVIPRTSELTGNMYKVTYIDGASPKGTVVLKMFSMFGSDSGEYVLSVQNGIGNGLNYRFTVMVLTGNETCSQMADKESGDSESVDIAFIIGVSVASATVVGIMTFMVGWKFGTRHLPQKQKESTNIQPSLDYSTAPPRAPLQEAYLSAGPIHFLNQQHCKSTSQDQYKHSPGVSYVTDAHTNNSYNNDTRPCKEPEEVDDNPGDYVELDSFPNFSNDANGNTTRQLTEKLSHNKSVEFERVNLQDDSKNNDRDNASGQSRTDGYEVPSPLHHDHNKSELELKGSRHGSYVEGSFDFDPNNPKHESNLTQTKPYEIAIIGSDAPNSQMV